MNTDYAHISPSEKRPPDCELFGTYFRVNARWLCVTCGHRNVTKLGIPLRAREEVFCRSCRRRTTVTIDLKTVPPHWGGSRAAD